MLDFCSEIPTGNVGLLLDSFHWFTSGSTWAELEGLRAAQVVEVHVSDAPAGVPVEQQLYQVRGLPGETGVIDVPRFLKTLDTLGDRGPVAAEPFSQLVNGLPPPEAVQVTKRALDIVWRQAGLPLR